MQTIRLPEVLRIAGVSKSTLRTWELAGKFPKRFKLGPLATGWDREAVERWREERRTGGAQQAA